MRHSIAAIKAQMRGMCQMLNTTDLCIEWNLSTVKMQEATTDQRRLEIAEVRDFLLEEFERRDPVAFRAWFEDDDPSDDPRKYYKSTEPSKFKPTPCPMSAGR